jgi:hypothetical protein
LPTLACDLCLQITEFLLVQSSQRNPRAATCEIDGQPTSDTTASPCYQYDFAFDQHGSSPFRLAWFSIGAPLAMPTILLQRAIWVHPETRPLREPLTHNVLTV